MESGRYYDFFAVYYQDATLSRDGNDILLNATRRQENLFEMCIRDRLYT